MSCHSGFAPAPLHSSGYLHIYLARKASEKLYVEKVSRPKAITFQKLMDRVRIYHLWHQRHERDDFLNLVVRSTAKFQVGKRRSALTVSDQKAGQLFGLPHPSSAPDETLGIQDMAALSRWLPDVIRLLWVKSSRSKAIVSEPNTQTTTG
ncbi:hypothetical protein [Pseudomonas sp. B20]|uniref:hypothetical protein n=1 Tax=Pseudomonas sp. B20 TaxID=129268 RepID=UPI001CF9FAAC|nr:hypothetical protein [Pseudomonas sp. B20]